MASTGWGPLALRGDLSGYVARETAGNLRRNLVMTFSAIITMAVSLSALGGVLIMRQAINKASIQWKGGVEMAIFLQPTIPANETAAIGHELASTPGVKKFHFVDKAQAYRSSNRSSAATTTSSASSASTTCPRPTGSCPPRLATSQNWAGSSRVSPGVLQVSYAQQEIDALLHQFKQLRLIGLFLAVGVMIGAVALIVNTIQLAIFARRREVAVMKLVGATNWFIRVPFMLEGSSMGWSGPSSPLRSPMASVTPSRRSSGNETVLGTRQLFVTPHEAIVTGLMLLVVGAARRRVRICLRRSPFPGCLGPGAFRPGCPGQARAATWRTAAATASGCSWSSRWWAPATTVWTAPGIAAASDSPRAAGTTWSALPLMTPVGTARPTSPGRAPPRPG